MDKNKKNKKGNKDAQGSGQQSQRPGGQQQRNAPQQGGGQGGGRPQQGGQGGGRPQDSRPQQGGQGGGRPQDSRPQQGGQGGGRPQDSRPQQGGQGGAWQDRSQQGGQGGGRPQQGGQGGTWQDRSQQGGQGGGRPQQGGQGGGWQDRSQQGGQGGGRPQQGGNWQDRGGQGQGGAPRQYGDRPQGGGGGGYGRQGGGYGGGGRGGGEPQVENPPMPRGKVMEGSAISCCGIKRGSLGQTGVIATNYLELQLDKMPKIAYHYDVTITPDRPKKFYRPAFEAFVKTQLKNMQIAFDGIKSCYSAEKIKNIPKPSDVEVTDAVGKTLSFKVAIKPTETLEIDMECIRNYHKDRVFDKPMRVLQCLEVVLANPCHEKGVRAGRSFFVRPKTKYSLDEGYEAWTGLYQAAILGDQPFLNVDISHKSFPSEGSVLDIINNDYNTRGYWRMGDKLEGQTLDNVGNFLRGISVIYTPPKCFDAKPRIFKVNDISYESANVQTFKNTDGQMITIAKYFESRGAALRYPNMQCLVVGPANKTISLPMEFCNVPGGQAINKKDGSRQVQNMIRFAATSTQMRYDKIQSLLKHFQHNADPTVSRFGLRLGDNFISVQCRVLPSPMLEYANTRMCSPNNGSWRMDNYMFYKPKPAPQAEGYKWAIVHFSGPNCRLPLPAFEDHITRQAKKVNVHLKPSATVLRIDNRQLVQTLNMLKSEKCALVFVVLPGRGTTYAEIKKTAELQVGILTQCIKDTTMEKRLNEMLALNLMLKVNAKLNGANHIISKKSTHSNFEHVMFLGADVSHPSKDQQGIPSIVGSAASHDPFGACYNMQYRTQKSGIENIENIESIITEHLRMYQSHIKSYPKHIIYYRDGVSDGQFPIVKNNEIRGIRNACNKLKIDIKITCLIVVKRHHTRFFPHGNEGKGKFNNVTPGTVVDRTIVHPNEMQFFMVSHESIQGTAKPTRYNVIVNDPNYDVDFLQSLTYNLCHMFPRCNRVVSYPAPAYLAHLVAFRGRAYCEGRNGKIDVRAHHDKLAINKEFQQNNPMYFV